ncbi:uncharacterized protein [Penaeus vannamei]|uniref:uncharacterized protein n=1 Tax=Penaeus vannamei TaxID=6689 RepID=UPI00387FA1E5
MLWNAVFEMGFSVRIIELNKDLYKDQQAAVRTTHGLTDWFNVEKALDKAVSCHHIYLIYSMNGFKGSIKISGRTITNLRYAEDDVLIASSMTDLQDLVNKVNFASNQYGLTLNTSKTKVMKIVRNKVENRNDNDQIVLNNTQGIETVLEQ